MTESTPPTPRPAAERGLPGLPWGWFVVGLSLLSVRGLVSRVRGVARGVRSGGLAGGLSQLGAVVAEARGRSGAVGRRVDSVADYFATLEDRFVPGATRGLAAVFQWEIDGEGDEGGTYHAIIDDGTMTLVPGRHASPTVTIAMNAADYVRVVNGELDGARAFTTGGGKVRGKIRMAMKMRSIFPQAS